MKECILMSIKVHETYDQGTATYIQQYNNGKLYSVYNNQYPREVYGCCAFYSIILS